MDKFITVCHSDYIYSRPMIIKGSEYLVTHDKGVYNVYSDRGDWITRFGTSFENYFYRENQVDKIREQRLKSIVGEV